MVDHGVGSLCIIVHSLKAGPVMFYDLSEGMSYILYSQVSYIDHSYHDLTLNLDQ